MNKRYRVLFFDFDGTICDTYEGIEQILDLTFAHYGLDVDRARYRSFVGPPLNETFEQLIGDRERAYEAVGYFRNLYVSEQAIYKTCLYDGIAEVLERAHASGYTVAVATCKKQEEAERLLEHFGLSEHIDFVSGLCYHVRETKTQVLQYALDALGVSASECLMIGDTRYDVEGAADVRMDCALCLWGFGDYAAIRNSNVVMRVHSPRELAERLLAATE